MVSRGTLHAPSREQNVRRRMWTARQGAGPQIAHDLAFEVMQLDANREPTWDRLALLTRDAMKKDEVEGFWSQKKILSPSSVVRVLLDETVLTAVRRELNRAAPARLEMKDVFGAVRDVLSKEALADAGELWLPKKRRKRRKVQRTIATTGQTVVEEVEVDDDGPEGDVPAALSVPPPMPNQGESAGPQPPSAASRSSRAPAANGPT